VALTNSQYETIFRVYEEKQLHNHRVLEDRFHEIYEKIPEYRELELLISSTSVSLGKKMLGGDDQALSVLKEKIKDFSFQKKQLLINSGYKEDYLSPIYHCSNCLDSGYTELGKCKCFKQAMISMLYAQSNIQGTLKDDNFSNLSTSFFTGEDLLRFEKAVTTSKKFIKTFKEDYQNLFFYGTVGTGKSFLSSCIAKELIDKGFSVIYFSSSQMFETLGKYSFDYKSKEELKGIYNDIYNCDLLIIDDLGTEMSTKFISSQLFSCLNERHLRKKSTIISTNLFLEELCATYSERIFSRITNNYQVCKLSGSDIRMLKKRMAKRK